MLLLQVTMGAVIDWPAIPDESTFAQFTVPAAALD
jgi:hypothetical protein